MAGIEKDIAAYAVQNEKAMDAYCQRVLIIRVNQQDLFSCRASPTPRFTVVTDFPQPPFLFVITIVLPI